MVAFNDSGAAQNAVAVTTSDSTNLANRCRGIYVGVSGDLSVLMADDGENGTAVLFKGLAAGVIHAISAVRIRTTGTTATDIVALR